MHLVAVEKLDNVQDLIEEISAKYEPLHTQIRNGLKRVLTQLKILWPDLPSLEPAKYDLDKTKNDIRQKLVTIWERSDFIRYPELPIEVPPQFVLTAERLAQNDRTSPVLRQGVRLVSKELHLDLLDYLNLAGQCVSGEIMKVLHQGAPLRAATRSPITRFWGHEIFTKYDVAGVSIAFLLWLSILESVLGQHWKEKIDEQQHQQGSDLPAPAISALDKLSDLAESMNIMNKLLALGRWSYHPKLKLDTLNKEVDTHWRQYLQSALWGELGIVGGEAITNSIVESPLVTPIKANITEPDLLAIALFSHKLDWQTIQAVFEDTKDAHGLVINTLTNDERLKLLASDSTKFNRALTRAVRHGYIPEGVDITVTEQPLPFNRTIKALRRQYLRS